MVCVPCIVIPILLWVFHKFIQPWIVRFWKPSVKSPHTTNWDLQGLNITDPEFKYLYEKVKEHPVMIFSKTTCSYCAMAKKVLDEIGVEYVVVEINQRDDCDKLQDLLEKVTGQRSVPRVFVNGTCIGGGSETWTLHNQGQLVPMLEEAGAVFIRSQEKKKAL